MTAIDNNERTSARENAVRVHEGHLPPNDMIYDDRLM